jgi:predicted HAD superfamily Cof-like phosphohydrolase
MSYRMIHTIRRLMCDKFSVLCTREELNAKQLREIERGNGMNKQYEMVADFQTKMGQPVADKPTEMRFARREQRFNYMAEELEEFIHSKTVVDQADAMIDLIYLAIGTMVELGVKPEALFEIVHNANMSKLWPDGKAKLNPETGKVIKPPTFVRPEPLLQAEIERQIRAGVK